MPTLRPATRGEIASILKESRSIWGAGLRSRDYLAMWLELMETPWGRAHFEYLVRAGGDGEVLSSLKLYTPRLRIGGRVSCAAVIGAIFTPPRHRRKGHAAALVRATVAEASARGYAWAALFSDIGTDYYAALGFRPFPAEEATGTLDRIPTERPAGLMIRGMRPEDLDPVREAHDAWCDGRPLAVLRDRDHWEFLISRAAGYFSRLDGSGLAGRYQVVHRRGRFAGYLVGLKGGGTWHLRECGAVGNDPGMRAEILRLGALEARAAGLRAVRGWLPRETAELVPEWNLEFGPRRRAVPMILPIEEPDSLLALEAPEASFVPYLDQF